MMMAGLIDLFLHWLYARQIAQRRAALRFGFVLIDRQRAALRRDRNRAKWRRLMRAQGRPTHRSRYRAWGKIASMRESA